VSLVYAVTTYTLVQGPSSCPGQDHAPDSSVPADGTVAILLIDVSQNIVLKRGYKARDFPPQAGDRSIYRNERPKCATGLFQVQLV